MTDMMKILERFGITYTLKGRGSCQVYGDHQKVRGVQEQGFDFQVAFRRGPVVYECDAAAMCCSESVLTAVIKCLEKTRSQCPGSSL